MGRQSIGLAGRLHKVFGHLMLCHRMHRGDAKESEANYGCFLKLQCALISLQ